MQPEIDRATRDPPNQGYNQGVSRSLKLPRPKQGAHLVALRRAKGLTQAELALAVGETQQNIAFWEKSDKPPRSDVLPRLAKVLSVKLEDLLVETATTKLEKAQPVGHIQKAFNEVRKLPRRQQLHVLELVETFIDRYRKRAS
jgi:transcriptional regulator with XRE-family HTH domain